MIATNTDSALLLAQAHVASERLAPYQPDDAAPWEQLITTLLQCSDIAPDLLDWTKHLECIAHLITGGYVLPTPKQLRNPRFHALLAEFVCFAHAAVDRAGDALSQGDRARLAVQFTQCAATKAAYEAKGPFLPYLHAVLALCALNWEIATTYLAAQMEQEAHA